MASTTTDIPRKVRQLENDVTSIYEILGRIEQAQGGAGKQLAALDAGQVQLAAKLTRQGNRLDELAAGQDAHAAELAKVQTTLQRQNNRLDELAAAQDEQGQVLAAHSTVLAEHSTVLAEHSTVLAEHSRILAEHSTILTEHTTRLDKVSSTQDAHSTVLAEHSGKLDTILELLRTR